MEEDSGRDKMTSELTTKDSELLIVMEERTFSTPEDVGQRNREAIDYARCQQDVQINKLLAPPIKQGQTVSTPEDVDKRNHETMGFARCQQDIQINNLLASKSKR